MGDATTRGFSLPLPTEVVQGEFGTGWYYERFSPFTWEWAWRRTLIFGVIALPLGALLGVIHGLFASSFSQGLAVGWRSALAMLLLVALGPALAAAVRRAGWRRRAEVAGVVTAILAGILISLGLRLMALDYHDHLMGRHLTTIARLVQLFHGDWPLHSMVENAADLVAALTLHAMGGGALALRSYFGEPQRERDHAARRELEQLRQQKLAAEARLAVLQAQVEPHFLFNALASASAEIENDPRRARDLIHALAQYLRSTLPKLRHESTARSTLEEQFEICRRYLEVMALRLGDRLTFAVTLPEEFRPLPFPPLLLISLVENAVTHGVERKAGAVRIEINARLLDAAASSLEVVVRDDGVGLAEGLVEGTGISNVRSQLAMLYGDAARMRIESPVEGGVRASLVVPLTELHP
jgi:hypothetical protein